MSTHTPIPPTPQGAGSPAPRRRRWLIALISVVAIIALGAIGIFVWQQQQQRCVKAPDPARSGAISEYCPSEPYQPTNGGAMVSGPDGNLWYVDGQQRIARYTLKSGAITEFAAPTAPNNVAYAGMAQGKDGNIWYVANYTLGRISMNGAFKEFALPQDMGFVGRLAVGTDGTLWVTMGSDYPKGGLLRVIPSSDASAAPQITKVTLPLAANTQIGPIAAAPDGSLWAAWYVRSGDTVLSTHILRVTPAEAVTQLPLTISGTVTSLAAGPNGKMWFVSAPGHMGRITLDGAVTLFNVSQIGEMAGVSNLAVEPNGIAWFSTSNRDGTSGVGRITPTGAVTTYTLPHSGGGVNNIIVGPDGGIWLILGYSQPLQPSSRLVRITP